SCCVLLTLLVAALVSCRSTAPTEPYPLSLHDALPIWAGCASRSPRHSCRSRGGRPRNRRVASVPCRCRRRRRRPRAGHSPISRRSEEHTSELQSHLNLVCRLLLEKKKISGRRLWSPAD